MMNSKLFIKVVFTLCLFWPYLVQGQRGTIDVANSCATSSRICGDGKWPMRVNLSIPENVKSTLVLPQYHHMICTESGQMQLTTNIAGTYIVYGPFSLTSNNLERCDAIALGIVNTVSSGVLTGTNGSIPITHGVGVYVVRIDVGSRVQYPTNNLGNLFYEVVVKTSSCKEEPTDECRDCLKTFSPQPGKYIISAWVKGESSSINSSYTNPFISVGFNGGGRTSFNASGTIIDDWQKIDAIIEVPYSAVTMQIELGCRSGDCYFDDFRFYPIDGSMVTYTYDPITMRLVAQLDERNYSTLYEYDEEGQLIRVKKETERGIMTIQENRNNIKK